MQHIRLSGLYIPFVPAYTEYRNMEKGRIRLKLLVFVLDKVENLEPVLNKFEHIGIKGATIWRARAWPARWKAISMVRSWALCAL